MTQDLKRLPVDPHHDARTARPKTMAHHLKIGRSPTMDHLEGVHRHYPWLVLVAGLAVACVAAFSLTATDRMQAVTFLFVGAMVGSIGLLVWKVAMLSEMVRSLRRTDKKIATAHRLLDEIHHSARHPSASS